MMPMLAHFEASPDWGFSFAGPITTRDVVIGGIAALVLIALMVLIIWYLGRKKP